MKLRLSRFLAAALLASLATAHAGEPITFGADLGNVMYVGDSITDGVSGGGVNAKSWRYAFFQVLADNGIAQNEEGYYQHTQSSKAITTAAYGGRTFENIHSAQASARSTQTVGDRTGRYDNTNIYNWLGQSTEKTGGGTYSGPAYSGEKAPDTFFVLLGTNDTLSEDGGHMSEDFYNRVLGTMYGYSDGSFDGKSGTFDKMYASMAKANPDAKVVVLEIPTWSPNHSNNNYASDFAYIARVNEKLHEWAATKGDNVMVVKADTGIVDVANTAKPGAAIPAMTIDGLHPSAQGELLMAGNVAKAMGYAGRTVGLDRADATTPNTDWGSIAAPLTVTSSAYTVEGATFDITDGCTVDFNAAYGNGGAGGWDNANAFTITVGDGAHTGTLSLTEAYVKWNDNTVLYSRDNSVVSADNLRIAYVNPSVTASDNVSAGYYVWLGDQLIGEGLTATTGDFNGIRLQSTGVNTTVSSLTWSDTAYSPTTTAYWNEKDAFKLEQSNPMPSHDNTPVPSTVDWSIATPASYDGSVKQDHYAVNSAGSGTATVSITITNAADQSWLGAKGGNNVFNGDINMEVKEGSYGSATVFGVVNGNTANGNVTVELNSSTAVYSSFTRTNAASLIGGYKGSITGTFTGVVNKGTLQNGIIGGFHTKDNGNHIGAVNLVVNGGTVGGNVYGGSIVDAAIDKDISITMTGGQVNGSIIGSGTAGTVGGDINIRITGGIINGDVIGSQAGATVKGTTSVTVESYMPFITGNITADKVVLKDVSATPYPDGFDKYAGTVTATDTVTLDNYRVENAPVSVVAKNLALVNGSKASLNSATLTGNGSINLTAGTELSAKGITCSGATRLTGAGTLAVTGVPANLTLDSAWSGTVRVSDANVQNLEFDKLAQGDSILELNGFSGWSKNWNGSNTQNIKLTDSDSNVAWENGAYSRDPYEGVYSGDWSGEGTLVMYANNGGSRHTSATFTGDISEWTGRLLFRTNNASSDLALKFGGKVDEVNAEIGFFGTGGIINMTVESDVTFTKNVNVTSLTVAQGKTVKFEAGFTSQDEFKLNPDTSIVQSDVTTQEVAFSADDGGVKVTNTGVQAAAYSTGNAYMLVHADTLSKKGTGDVTVNNQLEILNVVNTTGGKLTLSADEVLELHDMTLTGQNAAVEVLDRNKVGQEAKVGIGGTLTAGGATLLANLELQDGATLDVDGKTMTLGSQLTLGKNLYLDAATMKAMDALEVGQTHYIIRNYKGTNISYTENYDGAWYGSLFNRVSDETDNAYRLTGDYTIVATPNEVGFYKVSMTPEPTTGTLSVLALCALAARRRKHN